MYRDGGLPFANPLHPLDGDREHVSDAALGLDHARSARVALKLAPEAKNLHVDTAIEHVFMHARGLQQMLAAERALRRVDKSKQQGIFALGQGHRPSFRISEPPRPAVEMPAGKTKFPAPGI